MKTHQPIDFVVCPATRSAPRQSEASILPFDDGRLLLAYTDFFGGQSDDHGSARIAGRWSNDEGDTWSEPFVIQENYSRINIMEASLLRLSCGRILLAWNRVEERPNEQRGFQIIHLDVIHSDDEGRTWSPRRQISTDPLENMTTNDRLVQLRSGRVLLPASGSHNPVWISDDDGLTWRQGRGGYACAAEPVAVELPSGQLKLYSRETSSGPYRHLHVADSFDGGETWAPAPEPALRSAPVPCNVKLIPGSGDLLIIWNNADIRTNLCSAISSDGGKTWRHFRLIEPLETWPMIRSNTYPSIAFLRGHVHMTYWEVDKDPQQGFHVHLIYRRVPLRWLYEPPATARQCRQATLINT